MAPIFMVVTSLYIITTLPWLLALGTTPPDTNQSTITCNNCCQGPAGIPGVPGAAGIPGTPGAFGPQGPLGPKGESGLPGPSIKGQKGNAGVVGPSGPRGELGLQGPPGKVGPMGARGPRGDNGLDGAKGNHGLKGEKGMAGNTAFAGFTVTKTNSQPGQSGGGIVTFDTVITDIAGAYDTNTHKFTCSVPGYYLFTINASSLSSQNPWIQLIHNGNQIVHTYGYGSTRNMASNSALILLAAGDQVWIHNGHSNTDIYAHPTLRVTTFTGVLLHATN